MKKIWFMSAVLTIIFCFISIDSVVFIKEPKKETEQNFDNLKYLNFEKMDPSEHLDYLYLEETDDETGQKIKPTTSWLNKRKSRWINAFKKMAMMLPESFFKKIGKTLWTFCVDQNDWLTAQPGKINLVPSLIPPDWMSWEPYPVNGYSQEEMMFVALHELGHIYDNRSNSYNPYYAIYYRQYQGISWWNNGHLETISSIHCLDSQLDLDEEEKTFSGVWYYKGATFIIGTRGNGCHVHEFSDSAIILPLENYVTLYSRKMGQGEDFADSFALYVMWPEYLKSNFPLHYKAVKKILDREYKSTYPMPSSLKSRLTVRDYATNSR